MWELNVGKPLRQAEQAHPEGTASLTPRWHQKYITHRSIKQKQEPQQPVFPEKKNVALSYLQFTDGNARFVTRGNITRKTKHCRQRLWANCFQARGDVRRRSNSSLAPLQQSLRARSVAQGAPSQERHSTCTRFNYSSSVNDESANSTQLSKLPGITGTSFSIRHTYL